MTGNGRGTMRPQGRSPPFLLIGLLVALCILGYSYWNISSQSHEQASRVARLQDEVRMLSTRNLEGNKRAELTSNRLADFEKQVASLKTSLKDKNMEIEKKSEELQGSLAELESKHNKLVACEEEKNRLQEQVTKLEGEKASLEQQLKDKPDECDESACAESIKNVLSVVVKRIGPQAVVQSLQAGGIDPSKYVSPDAQMIQGQGGQGQQGLPQQGGQLGQGQLLQGQQPQNGGQQNNVADPNQQNNANLPQQNNINEPQQNNAGQEQQNNAGQEQQNNAGQKQQNNGDEAQQNKQAEQNKTSKENAQDQNLIGQVQPPHQVPAQDQNEDRTGDLEDADHEDHIDRDDKLKFEPHDLKKEPGIEIENDEDAIDRMNDNMALNDRKPDEDSPQIKPRDQRNLLRNFH